MYTVYPGTVTMPCLRYTWAALLECPNADYVNREPHKSAWQNSNLSSVQEAMWAISMDAENYFTVDLTDQSTTYVDAAAACYGINRYQAVGDEPVGAEAENLIPFVKQCPVGTYITKVTFEYRSGFFWIATCSDGSLLEPIMPGVELSSPPIEVYLPEGFDEATVLGQLLFEGVWSSIVGRGFSLKGSRMMPWAGVIGWDLPEDWKPYFRQAVTKCLLPGEVAVGWHGSMSNEYSGQYTDLTLGLICQKRELLALMP